MKRFILIGLTILSTTPLSASKLNIQHWQTNNGVDVYFVKERLVPMVDVKIAFRAGSAFDGKKWGIATLTAALVNQGAGGLGATAIAENFENYGALYQYNVSRDMTTFSLRSLSKESALEPALQNFTTVLTQPDFKDKDIKREKNQQLASIKESNERPNAIANNAFYANLYGAHPYAHPTIGTKETVKGMSQKDIKSFYQNHYLADDAIIAIVGDIDKDKANQIAKRITENLPSLRTHLTVPKVTRAKRADSKDILFPSSQTVIRLGQLGIDYHSPHYFPIIVGNYTLGGSGLVSRLANEIREKRGLSYGVSSSFSPLLAKGPFIIGLATKTKQREQAVNVTLDTLKQFVAKGPTDKELQSAKKYLNGSFPLRLSSNKNVLNAILTIGFYGLPLDFLDTYLTKVNKVTHDEIKMAFKQLVKPNQLLMVTVGQK